jgi:hypothetical protein
VGVWDLDAKVSCGFFRVTQIHTIGGSGPTARSRSQMWLEQQNATHAPFARCGHCIVTFLKQSEP